MNNCNNCGTPLIQGAKYCHNCGNISRDISTGMPYIPGKEATSNINYGYNKQDKRQFKFSNNVSQTRRKNMRKNWLLIILLTAAILAIYIIINILTNT